MIVDMEESRKAESCRTFPTSCRLQDVERHFCHTPSPSGIEMLSSSFPVPLAQSQPCIRCRHQGSCV